MEIRDIPPHPSESCFSWTVATAFELGFFDWALEWANRALHAAPLFFEPKGFLAHMAFKREDWSSCYKFAIQIETHNKAQSHFSRDSYWDWYMFDLIIAQVADV